MPELPEVETVCRGLDATIKGRKFVRVQNFRPNLRIPFPQNFSSLTEGQRVLNISRRAKYIIIEMDNGKVIIAHLGMSGRMVVHNQIREKRDKHDHATFLMDDGKEVVFNDPRRFGLIDICGHNELPSHKLIANLGVEPLTDDFNGLTLFELLKGKSAPIKNVIMDANLVVGVGNIYACESLFRSHISPLRAAKDINEKECAIFTKNIKEILLSAIESGGSTLRDYVKSSGEKGYFQHSFSVYGREGQACNSCSGVIKRIKQGGRSTFFCDNCQK